MHKPFQKFGLFVSKLEEATVSNDKKIKYLYKKDSPSDKYKRKIKSADDSNTKSKFSKKLSEDKHRIQKKKSDESFRKKHRKTKEHLSNTGISGTEILIAEDEKPKKKIREEKKYEIKRKRSKHRAEESEKRTVKKEDNFAKLLKQYKLKSSSKDSQWINKRDILKLISNVRDLPRDAGSGLLRKLFAFERTPEKERISDKASRRYHKEERSSVVPLTVESYRTLEKKTRERERATKEKSDLYIPKKVKKHKTEKEQIYQNDEETPSKPKKKHKKKSEEKQYVFEEPPQPVVKKETVKRNNEKYFLQEINNNIRAVEAVSVLPDPVRQHVTNVNRTNPLRHMQCLVKKTFSIVEISPESSVSYLEKKKNMKQFKKYYKYNQNGEKDWDINNNSARTFSDCHKMYQEVSTDEDANRRTRKTKKSGEREAKLRLETHISAVVIPADSERIIQQWSENISIEDKKVKKKAQKSRIPILSNFNKIMDSTRDSPRNRPINEQPSPKQDEKYLPIEEESREFSPKDEKTIKTLRKKIIDNVSTKATSDRSSHLGDKSPKTVKLPSKDTSVDKKSSKVSTLPKNTKTPNEKIDNKKDERPKPRPRTYRRSPADEKCSIKSNDYSSVYSRNSRKSTRSKSDTRIATKCAAARKCKTFERSSTKSSLSNSTFGDRSMESKNGTTFLLTKNFKDDEKLSRWQKRKMYSDKLRRNLINKGKKSSPIPPQVLEVRYLTVDKKENHLDLSARTSRDSTPHSKRTKHSVDVFFENDLPQPSFELIENEKIKDLFETPNDEALDDILNENYNFLKKDFSFPCNAISKLSISDEEFDEKDDWYDFQETESLAGSLSHRSTSKNQQQDMCLTSQEHITDSCSAPGSDESGYSTIKSRKMSTRSFFERTEIQNLLKPNFESSFNPFCMDVQIEHNNSSHCELEIRSIQSKSLQTIVECSQKSVQIKLSQEEILEMINFSEDEVVKAVNRDIQDESEPEINSESVSEVNFDVTINASKEIVVENLKEGEVEEIDKEEMVRDLLNEVLANVVKSKSAVIKTTKEKSKVSTIFKKVKRQMLFYFCIRCTSSDD